MEIPWEWGLLGHSDADVLTHAVMDALCGAAGIGDIGALFPDSDPHYAGISSLCLLEEVARLLHERGFSVVNVDATLVAQAPKIKSYKVAMAERLSGALGVNAEQVNVKATTEEGWGLPAMAPAWRPTPWRCWKNRNRGTLKASLFRTFSAAVHKLDRKEECLWSTI